LSGSKNSLSLALIASRVATTGHFDAVLQDIDKMIVALREEEKADIEHKDWCETENHNANAKNEALEYDMEELKAKVGRLESKKGELEAKIAKTETEMGDLEQSMKDALDNRNTENAAFKQALQDDTDAVALIQKAIESLSKFYSNNGLALVEKKKHHHKKEEPEYAANPDTAPETFSDGGYGGRSSENTGIVAIMGMIKEDLEKEMAKAQADEASSLAAYQKLYDESAASMQALEDKKTTLTSDVATTDRTIADTQGTHGEKSDQKDATDDMIDGLKSSCDWIMRTFESRRTARKAEIKGLQDAKSALAGAENAPAGSARLVATRAVTGKHRQSVKDALDSLDQAESRFEASFLQRY
jgi:chromosome segregation ATPase